MLAMHESDARAALIAMGIAPTRELIRNWLAAEAAGDEEQSGGRSQPQQPGGAASPTHPGSKSLLEPLLRRQGTLEKRRAGRPRIIASWFPAVAQTMADGTSLRTALAINGIHGLSKSELRGCYRNLSLKALYQEARRRFLFEHYGRDKRTLRAQLDKYV